VFGYPILKIRVKLGEIGAPTHRKYPDQKGYEKYEKKQRGDHQRRMGHPEAKDP